MADNSIITPGVGETIRDKDRSGVKTQIVGLDLGIGTGSESLMSGAIPVTDNSGSLTVDAPVGTPVFVRLSDGSSAIATLPVSLASFPAVASASISQLTSSASSQQLLASNAARKGLILFNDSTAICYVKFGTTASTSSYTIKMAAGAYWDMPSPTYTGRIDAIWASANGVLAATEL